MPMTYKNGVATATSTASKLVTVTAENDGIIVQNLGSVTVYLGGPSVTANQTATGGYPLAAGASQSVPSVGGLAQDLWAVTASSTAPVAWLQPTFYS